MRLLLLAGYILTSTTFRSLYSRLCREPVSLSEREDTRSVKLKVSREHHTLLLLLL